MQLLRVQCGQAGTLDTVAWATNLQANASAAGALNLAGVAASPATGGLLLTGEFSGQMAFGAHMLTAAGGTDAFAAELDPVNGCGGSSTSLLLWHACMARLCSHLDQPHVRIRHACSRASTGNIAAGSWVWPGLSVFLIQAGQRAAIPPNP